MMEPLCDHNCDMQHKHVILKLQIDIQAFMIHYVQQLQCDFMQTHHGHACL